MWDVGMLLVGGVLLYLGAEWLVGGAAGLARMLGVKPVLVGLTVVAYGTSAPEVVVGIQAAAKGHGAIALGNVVGSNIANIGLILGVTALIKPPRADGRFGRREVPILLLTAIAVPLLLLDGLVSTLEAALLISGAVAYTTWMVLDSMKDRAAVREAERTVGTVAELAEAAATHLEHSSRSRLVLSAIAGLALLVIGGQLLVDGASALALKVGMSQRVVGLTIVAVGTSLPELATSLIAAFRGHPDIAVGNVIGSNIFNVLFCLGSAALVGSVGAPLETVSLDVWTMVGLTVVASVMLRTARVISRLEGALLNLAYVGFLVALMMQGQG